MSFPVNHDLHTHTHLSFCSGDAAQNPSAILEHAKKCGYQMQAITDHMWDSLVPEASGWYEPQNIEHVSHDLPLPVGDEVKLIFGCETEFCGGKKLGLHPANFDKFGMIVIPPNHFHMKDFVRPSCCDTEEKVADLFNERLEELLMMDLPWKKVGIAHMVCSLIFHEGDQNLVYELIDEKRFRSSMRGFAKRGAGIEINTSCFERGWREHEDVRLRLYRMAKEEGCRFYLGSDAHHPAELETVMSTGSEVASLLELEESDLFTPAE